MKIDSITLLNFGPYEGENVLDTFSNGIKNITIIGGKNGAGKTTLFTAIKLCLYGHMSLGYKSNNSYYAKRIMQMMNNNAKLQKQPVSSVSMKIRISDGQGFDSYELIRSWSIEDKFVEEFIVKKNRSILNENDKYDFEKFLLNYLPLDVFNLYFFDGENIVDFFFRESSSTKIKNSFLLLCGYDTFEIMRRNFKRVAEDLVEDTNYVKNYLTAKSEYEKSKLELNNTKERLNWFINATDVLDDDINSLEKNYTKSGGISEQEWQKRLTQLKIEEKNRDNWNLMLKKLASEFIPLLMLKKQLAELKQQIKYEQEYEKYEAFKRVLGEPDINDLIEGYYGKDKTVDFVNRLIGYVSEKQDMQNKILDLSFEDSLNIVALANKVCDFNIGKILKLKSYIKESIERTAQIRKELELSSVQNVKEYMKEHTRLLQEKNSYMQEQIQLERLLREQEIDLENKKLAYEKARSIAENNIKQKSINDISSRAIIMLDNLQEKLYEKQIKKLEKNFLEMTAALMRKDKFLDEVYVDVNFNVHIYKNQIFDNQKIINIIEEEGIEKINSLFGEKAVKELKEKAGSNKVNRIVMYCEHHDYITLPVEINKMLLSSGEKQVFVMALYYSLVELSNKEIPFIIDTPFARIDKEHRENITKYFFNALKGQVFILSTNEEITKKHIDLMKNKVLNTYMLENIDNKKTIIKSNQYFEE